jgi:glucose-1-phosphate cytidylyltransferase
MKVVILCGGFGTRIRDVADDIPKPMIPVGNLPILWHIMKRYAAAGHEDFVLCLGYKGHAIKRFFLDYDINTQDFTIDLGKGNAIHTHGGSHGDDWRVTLAETGQNAMTGARIRRIRRYVADADNFLLTYGDGLSDVDFDALLAFHKAHGRILTVTGVRPPGRFGEIEHVDGRVSEFNEKSQAGGGLISGGFFVCRRELFDFLDDREDLVFEVDPIRALVAKGELMVFEHRGFWQCMDTHRDWTLLNDLWNSGKAPWKAWP